MFYKPNSFAIRRHPCNELQDRGQVFLQARHKMPPTASCISSSVILCLSIPPLQHNVLNNRSFFCLKIHVIQCPKSQYQISAKVIFNPPLKKNLYYFYSSKGFRKHTQLVRERTFKSVNGLLIFQFDYHSENIILIVYPYLSAQIVDHSFHV